MRGMDLKLKRVARRVSGVQIAREMGVSRARVSYIETLDVVTVQAAGRYLAALEKFPDLDRAA